METDAEIKKRVNDFYDWYFKAATVVTEAEKRIRKDQNERIVSWLYALDMSQFSSPSDEVREHIIQHLITEHIE